MLEIRPRLNKNDTSALMYSMNGQQGVLPSYWDTGNQKNKWSVSGLK